MFKHISVNTKPSLTLLLSAVPFPLWIISNKLANKTILLNNMSKLYLTKLNHGGNIKKDFHSVQYIFMQYTITLEIQKKSSEECWVGRRFTSLLHILYSSVHEETTLEHMIQIKQNNFFKKPQQTGQKSVKLTWFSARIQFKFLFKTKQYLKKMTV